eukprot:3518954-Pyramimonas_sp.AAC.1
MIVSATAEGAAVASAFASRDVSHATIQMTARQTTMHGWCFRVSMKRHVWICLVLRFKHFLELVALPAPATA